ncbi:MAG TPA: AbrB/MazE/SpoVT family DNA-binding domain-containing protein [Terracidiphilus sp.]|nr:AbrB/MazE/SpoVT family DNA-binding domain-containing protein [Terracidiphilus sp.]
MRTTLSTKGQVVLPGKIRERLDLRPGDPLEARIEGEHIVLIPQRRYRASAEIVKHPVTGLPVLSAGEGAPALTSREVAEILAELS